MLLTNKSVIVCCLVSCCCIVLLACTNPKGVTETIESVVSFRELPKKYELISAQRKRDFTEIRIDDKDMNVPIAIMRVDQSNNPETAAEIASRIASDGIPFETAWSANFITGGLVDRESGELTVAGRQMSYLTGHVEKPYFGGNTPIPAFFGCIKGQSSYLLICAQEADGWMPEKQREIYRKKRLMGQDEPSERSSYSNIQERVLKDFDMSSFKDFLSRIKDIRVE